MANPFTGLFGQVGGGFGGGLLDPRTAGLVSAAQAFGQHAGPTRMPTSTGSAMANAMAAGLSGHETARRNALAQQMAMANYQMQMAKMTQPTTDWKVVGDKLYKITNPAQLTAGPEGLGYNPLAGQASVTESLGSPKRPAPGMVWNPVSKTWSMDPAFKEFAFEKARLEKPSTTVNVQQEKSERKAYGTSLVKHYDAIRDAADVAETARQQIAMGRGFVRQDKPLPSVLQQAAGNAAAAMGFDVSGAGFKSVLGNISGGQGFTATMLNLVLSKMQAQKGPQTESDTRLIKTTVASLGHTPEARDFLLRASDALAQADVMKADFWRRWRSGAGKGSFDGAASAWRKFRNKVPFMAISPNTGKHVFFAEFADANRTIPFDEIVAEWSRVYAHTPRSR